MFNEIDIDKILSFESTLNPIQIAPRFERENLIQIESKQSNQSLTNTKCKSPKSSVTRIDERFKRENLIKIRPEQNNETKNETKNESPQLLTTINKRSNGEQLSFDQFLLFFDLFL